MLTCYSPVRHSCTPKSLTVRLACVKHAASVRPEPGSNSPLKFIDAGFQTRSSSIKVDTDADPLLDLHQSSSKEPLRPDVEPDRDGCTKKCAFGIDFKHAVEFSSFGCVPGRTLSAPAGGNSDYFSRAFRRCQTGSFPDFLALLASVRELIRVPNHQR